MANQWRRIKADKQISIYLTTEQFAFLTASADKSNMGKSEYIKYLIERTREREPALNTLPTCP